VGGGRGGAGELVGEGGGAQLPPDHPRSSDWQEERVRPILAAIGLALVFTWGWPVLHMLAWLLVKMSEMEVLSGH